MRVKGEPTRVTSVYLFNLLFSLFTYSFVRSTIRLFEKFLFFFSQKSLYNLERRKRERKRKTSSLLALPQRSPNRRSLALDIFPSSIDKEEANTFLCASSQPHPSPSSFLCVATEGGGHRWQENERNGSSFIGAMQIGS